MIAYCSLLLKVVTEGAMFNIHEISFPLFVLRYTASRSLKHPSIWLPMESFWHLSMIVAIADVNFGQRKVPISNVLIMT